MGRRFNSTGSCNPKDHYMVDLQERLAKIRKMVERGDYFTINRARQYGKTTMLAALADDLAKDYIVISLDFQKLSSSDYENERTFANAFSDLFLLAAFDYRNREHCAALAEVPAFASFQRASEEERISGLRKLFSYLVRICASAPKQIVLIIDEVDSATNNQVFLDFLAQLRGYYLTRTTTPTFQSVILAGVYDIKNLRLKIRPESEHKINSPWNIAADFDINMSFTVADITGMLREYEADHQTGMDLEAIAGLLYDYTSGYPFLVSRLCKLMDEKVAGTAAFPTKADAWTKDGFLEAVKLLLSEKNTLFESLMGKLVNDPELREKLYTVLFSGERIVYNVFDPVMDLARMFGFVRKEDNAVVIANRIFETILYDYFLTTGDAQQERIFQASSRVKNQYFRGGRLDMELVLTKFVEHFNAIYGSNPAEFSEEEGRRRFLLYLRPIINGSGNYYIEAQTRDARRMDVVVDYQGEQFIVELKLWRGNAYNERGEQQLSDYLDYFKLKKGYMLSYNFNRKKQPGVKTLTLGDRTLVEAVV